MMGKRLILFIAALLAVLLVVFSQAVFFVQPGQVAVVTGMGRPARAVGEGEMGFKVPFAQQVARLDSRIIITPITGVRSVTASGENIFLSADLRWRIVDPLAFFEKRYTEDETGKSLFILTEQLLQQAVSGYKEAAFSQEAVSKMKDGVLQEINRKTGDMGVLAVTLHIVRAEPADAAALLEDMRTAWQGRAREILAQGEAEADRLKAEAEKERNTIATEALKQEFAVRSKGEAEAARIMGQAFMTAPPEFRDFFIKMELKRLSLKSNVQLIFSLDDPVMQCLP